MKRKRYSGDLKAKVALEALKGLKTTNGIAPADRLHPNLVGLWKRQALEALPELFSLKWDRAHADYEELKRELYARIGELEMELEWLKRNGGASPSRFSFGPTLRRVRSWATYPWHFTIS